MAISGGLLAQAETKSAELTAVITRADGTIVNLGTIAYWHRNPLKRWAHALTRSLQNFMKG